MSLLDKAITFAGQKSVSIQFLGVVVIGFSTLGVVVAPVFLAQRFLLGGVQPKRYED